MIARSLLVAVAFAACGGGEGTTSPGTGGGSGGPAPPPAAPDEGPVTPGGPRTVTVEIQFLSYNAPGGGNFLTIGLGEQVRWVNLDGTLHTVTSTSVPTGGKGFNSGQMHPGSEFAFAPSVTGTWEYTCLEYPHMAGARLRVVD